MTAAAEARITRFRHYDGDVDIYVGEAETDHDDGISILSCWRLNTGVEEVYPYDHAFPVALRAALHQTATEQRYDPPVRPIEVPSDWNAIRVESVEHIYTITTTALLPLIQSDEDRDAFGLRAVQRCIMQPNGKFAVRVKGGFDDMMRELSNARGARHTFS